MQRLLIDGGSRFHMEPFFPGWNRLQNARELTIHETDQSEPRLRLQARVLGLSGSGAVVLGILLCGLSLIGVLAEDISGNTGTL